MGVGVTPVVDMATYSPTARLGPFVDSIVGYRLSGLPPGVHLGLPSRSLTAIVSFDDPINVVAYDDGRTTTTSNFAMASGLHHEAVDICHNGTQHGIQINFSPRGARAIFGVPAGRLSVGGDDLTDLWGRQLAGELHERTASVDTWSARFAAIDDILTRALGRFEARSMGAHCAAVDAWDVLCATRGRLSIGQLADELGWSRRLISARFTDEFGLAPKTLATVLRFDRAVQELKADPSRSLSDVAARCGYSDQAHFTREWRKICRTTPTSWLRDEVFPNVQDADARPTQGSPHE